MNNAQCAISICTLALTLGCAAASANPDATRDRLRAELIAARQAGELPVGEPEIAPRDMFPWLYPPAPTSGPPASRAKVRAQAVAAVKAGDILTSFADRPARELFPAEYSPSKHAPNLAHASALSHASY